MGGEGEEQREMKAEIANHPLCEQLLAAHVACLRVATPIDQLPLIDAQLSHSHHILSSYAASASHHTHSLHRQDLDNFLVYFIVYSIYFQISPLYIIFDISLVFFNFHLVPAGSIFDSVVYFQGTASATCQGPCRRSCHGLP